MILGDAYQEIKLIPDNSIDLIVTDPPYDINAKIKTKHTTELDKSYYNLTNDLIEANAVNGINLTILDEFVRVLKTINLYIWCNKKQILPYLQYFNALGCTFNILVWIKSNPIPIYGRQYINDKEYCLYFSRKAKLHTTYDTGHTYWITPTNKKDKKLYGHPTVKPEWIIKNLILNSSEEGDVILDPFAGSGTTGAAALSEHRSFVGIEMNKMYYDVSVKRLQWCRT